MGIIFFKKVNRLGYYITVISIFFLLASCKKENQDLPEPIKQLIAVYKNDDCICDSYIDKYEWQNQVVYVSGCKGPACDCLFMYYDQNGIEIKMAEGYFTDDFFRESRLVENVWSCKH